MKKIYYFNMPKKTDMLPIYPVSLGYDYDQGPIERVNGYSGYQWLQTTSGSGAFHCGETTFELPVGCGIFIDKTTAHNYHEIGSGWKTSWVVFDGEYVEKILSYLELSYFKPYAITDVASSNSLFKELSKLSGGSTAKEFMEASTKLYRFFYEAGSTLIHTESTLFNRYEKLQPVIEYIKDNYTSDISLYDLASIMKISPQHFCVLFKSITSIRPMEYINKIRLSRAKELLQGTSYSINKIANMCGYESASYFYTIFKRCEGATPGEFRKGN